MASIHLQVCGSNRHRADWFTAVRYPIYIPLQAAYNGEIREMNGAARIADPGVPAPLTREWNSRATKAQSPSGTAAPHPSGSEGCNATKMISGAMENPERAGGKARVREGGLCALVAANSFAWKIAGSATAGSAPTPFPPRPRGDWPAARA